MLVCACAFIICCWLQSGAAAESTEDESFIRGYVAAILQTVGPLSRFTVHPVAAVDVKYHEEGGWAGDYSPRIGVQLSSGTTRNLQLLLEYFHGKSPNGQFYVNNVEYVGIGGHLHF